MVYFLRARGGESEASANLRGCARGGGAWLQVKLSHASSVHFICRGN